MTLNWEQPDDVVFAIDDIQLGLNWWYYLCLQWHQINLIILPSDVAFVVIEIKSQPDNDAFIFNDIKLGATISDDVPFVITDIKLEMTW